MNGYEICKAAFLRLGLNSDTEIPLHSKTSKRDLEFVNHIADDLNLKPLEELSAEVEWSAKETQAVISGVAMMLSFTEGETAKNQLFTAIYNAKRAALLGKISKIEDTLPTSESGDV